jgi:multiple sugar transport system permease protein
VTSRTNTLGAPKQARGPVVSERTRSAQQGRGPLRLVPTAILLLGTAYCLYPIGWVVTAATKAPAELFATAPFAPGTGLLHNLEALLGYRDGVYLSWAGNSLIYAGGGAAASTAISAAAGFALAKYRFRGRSVLFAILLAGVLLPQITLALPQYFLASELGVSNTYWSVFLPGIISPFGIYLARVYAEASIADELLEAARVDGATEARIFMSIGLPLLTPGLVTIFLLQFISIWNNFLLPFVMLASEERFPLTLGLFSIMSKSQENTLYTLAIVGAAVAVVPLLALVLVLQRFWRLDLLSGGLKA